MKKYKKQWFGILLILACYMYAGSKFVSASSGGGNGSIPSLTRKKIISVVYDDSGSMIGDATESANYAVQVFEALMGSGDKLYITYMSDIEEGRRTSQKIDLQNVNQAVSDFRNRQYNYCDTPLATIEVAFDTLKKIKENDVNTQFWLVILTDGDMDQTAKSNYQDLDTLLSDIKGTIMSNGTPLHIYYFGIGNGAKVVSSDLSNNLRAVNSQDIVPTLGDIANMISGRLKYDDKEIDFFDNHTVSVKSNLPLFSLSAFTQGSSAQVLEAECIDGKGDKFPMQVERNIHVEGMPPNNQQLLGNVAVVNDGKDILPSGEYTITFSEDIDSDNIVLMFQPAISLEAELTKDGVVVTDYSTLIVGDDLEINLKAIDMYTGKEIDPSHLPLGTTWEIAWDNGSGPQISSKSSETVSRIKPGDYTINGSISIPEMIPIMSNTIAFHVDDYLPEFKLRLIIIKKGNLNDEVVYDNVENINILSSLEATDLISVHLEAFDGLSGNPIDTARLGGTETYSISYEVDGRKDGLTSGKDYDNISLKAGKNQIIGDYNFVGNILQEAVDFEVAPPAVYDLELENNKCNYLRGNLKKDTTDEKTSLIWINRDDDADEDGIGDGNSRNLEEQECTGNKYVLFKTQKVNKLDDTFLLNRGLIEADEEIVLNNDGSFSVYPVMHSWFIRYFAPYVIRSGEYHVTVQLDANGKETEVIYTISPRLQDWIPMFVELTVLYIAIRIFKLLFLKPKFKKGRRIIVTAYSQKGDGVGVVQSNFCGSTTLKPYGKNPLSVKPARWEIPKLGIRVFADERGGVYFIQTHTNNLLWGITLVNPKRYDTLLNSVRTQTTARANTGSGIKSKKRKGAKAPRQRLSINPVYFTDAQGLRIYEVICR